MHIQNFLDEAGVEEDLVKHLYRELGENIKKDINEGKSVVVGGDFNETQEEKGLMYQTMIGLGMVNYFGVQMGKVPPTRKPGKRAIDHVWVTPECFREVKKAGIVGHEEVFLSDHVGIFLDSRVGDVGRDEDIDKGRRDTRSPETRRIKKDIWSTSMRK